MSERQTPFEKFYGKVKQSRNVDELALIEALHKTRLPKNLTLKVIYEIYRGQESKRFLNKDEFIGFIFDQCAIGRQYVFSVYYDKNAWYREGGLLTVYTAFRGKM